MIDFISYYVDSNSTFGIEVAQLNPGLLRVFHSGGGLRNEWGVPVGNFNSLIGRSRLLSIPLKSSGEVLAQIAPWGVSGFPGEEWSSPRKGAWDTAGEVTPRRQRTGQSEENSSACGQGMQRQRWLAQDQQSRGATAPGRTAAGRGGGAVIGSSTPLGEAEAWGFAQAKKHLGLVWLFFVLRQEEGRIVL